MPIIKARSSSIINSVDLRGTPTAPTAEKTVNTTQIASTAYVRTAITDIINASPALLDTLSELAAAIGNVHAKRAARFHLLFNIFYKFIIILHKYITLSILNC